MVPIVSFWKKYKIIVSQIKKFRNFILLSIDFTIHRRITLQSSMNARAVILIRKQIVY